MLLVRGFFAQFLQQTQSLYKEAHRVSFRIVLGKMTVVKQKSNEVMSTSRTLLTSLKPSPLYTLSAPIQPLPRDCLSHSISCQEHPAHGEGCCTTTPSPCQSCPSGWSQASAAMQQHHAQPAQAASGRGWRGDSAEHQLSQEEQPSHFSSNL